MRDRDYFDEEYERGRGYRRVSPREGYDREYERGYDRDRDYGYDRSRGDRIASDRYPSGYEPDPRYPEPRYREPVNREPVNREYADRERTRWSQASTPARSQLRCRDIMTTDLIVCHPDTNLREVAKLMKDNDTGVLPVVDNNGKVVGVITDRDIVVRILADKDVVIDAVVVNDAMSDSVYSVRPTDRVVDCIRKMGNKQVRRIIVTDDNDRLRGIISMGDVATEAEYDRELADAVEEISKPKSWFKRLFS